MTWIEAEPGDIVNSITNLDGVSWTDAPLPSRVHRCKPQTKGWRGLDEIQRCACGALRYNDHPWINKNERRKK